MSERLAFRPDASRARDLDLRMRSRLGDSLAYIADEVRGRLPVSQDRVGAFLERLALAPVSSIVFGAYCDLVLALEAGDLRAAAGLFDEIVSAPVSPEALSIRAIGDPDRETEANRYVRLINTDPSMVVVLRPPSPELEAVARQRLEAALRLLDQGFPELADEIRALVREIILAVNEEHSPIRVDGASSFMLWGAIIVNAELGRTRLELVQGLAHESGHNLLFGLCADGPLVENDDFDRFDSPLRADPRPMDGIVHAAYIVARMHQAVDTVLKAEVLEPDEADAARLTLTNHSQAFWRGMDTIDKHGRLTALGHDVIEGARNYMSAAADVGRRHRQPQTS
jgi:HEXXH motif-containing protein